MELIWLFRTLFVIALPFAAYLFRFFLFYQTKKNLTLYRKILGENVSKFEAFNYTVLSYLGFFTILGATSGLWLKLLW